MRPEDQDAVQVTEVAWRPADPGQRRALLHLLFGPPAAPDVTGRVSPRTGDAGEAATGVIGAA